MQSKMLFNPFDPSKSLFNHLNKSYLQFESKLENKDLINYSSQELVKDFTNFFDSKICKVQLDKTYSKVITKKEEVFGPFGNVLKDVNYQQFKFNLTGDCNLLFLGPQSHSCFNAPPEASVYKDYIILEVPAPSSTQALNSLNQEEKKIIDLLKEQEKDIDNFINSNVSKIQHKYNSLIQKTKEKEQYEQDILNGLKNK